MQLPRVLSLASLLLVSAAQAAPGAPDDIWPMTIPLGERKAILEAPHAESLEGSSLKARGGLGFVRKGETEPVWGSIWYEADVTVDRAGRSVTLESVRVPRVELAGVPPAQQERLAARLSQAVTRRRVSLSLDDVLAGSRTSRTQDAAPKLGTDPPKIVFENEPAILLVFDGEPRFHAVEGSHLTRAMNSAFLVLHDPEGGAFWLDGGTTWFRAPAPAGPWTVGEAPREAVEIARHDREEAGVTEKDVAKKDDEADARIPKILVATEPTELIVSDGAPRFTPLAEGLEALANSDNDVFRADGKYWIVLSGRWYQSDAMGGPWSFVRPDALPAAFHDIPADSPKSEVLAFVPGTAAAHEALEDASTPRTAAIRRKDAHVSVTYDGEPRFEQVSGTDVAYALNTQEQVLRIRGRYYACDQGVWFTSGAPDGPWSVADSIPDDDIQRIPPESPVYNTRFVTVYDATPDVVYTAYSPAYLGSYPYYGTVVFGTGWAYRPWWGAAYYPRPWTWGFGAFYRPWAGWGWGFGWRPAWAGFRWGFGFGWGARWCGPAGFYRPAFAAARFTRNVSITRNVNITRNVYNTGVNRTHAATTSTRTAAARTGTAPRNVSAQRTNANAVRTAQARPAATGKANPSGKAGPSGKSPAAAGKAHVAKAKGGHAGGKKH